MKNVDFVNAIERNTLLDRRQSDNFLKTCLTDNDITNMIKELPDDKFEKIDGEEILDYLILDLLNIITRLSQEKIDIQTKFTDFMVNRGK